ncbi:MAG: DNA-directed RNA polymerase subunit alpha [Candidatus Pacebacteria bacterium]|nr:DNA-directed RNA polymerase subunit alpha [Candidatus Paceibacterota bacterium]
MIPLPLAFKILQEKENYAKFVIEGLYPGYGITLGNALRRVLLSSLEGAAIVETKIKGVDHEFSTINGVLEDVVHICLNLKKLRFKIFSDEPIRAFLKVKGQKEVKGKNFELPPQLELVNKDQHIATLTKKDASLEMEIIVKKGVGYEPREMRTKEKLSVGQILLDAIYTPIKRVSYKVENMRVGERTDFDRLFLEIETDGTITPQDALGQAVQILLDHFNFVQDSTKPHIKKEEKIAKKEEKVEKDALTLPIDELKLSTRTKNALLAGHIKAVEGLVRKKEEDLLKLEGLGEVGIKEIKKALKKLGLELKS